MKEDKVELIQSHLDMLFPSPKCELEYASVYQLLVAVILSAQCTDKRVNIVTKSLFEEYGTPEKMLTLSPEELETKIKSCGFYRNKAKNILAMTRDLLEKYSGEVPSSMAELIALAGVGRKTANVVLAEGFKGDAIAVDTHVLRVSNRLGLVQTAKPDECESVLRCLFDQGKWSKLHLQMVHFGRYICKSQKPNCGECSLKDICVNNHKTQYDA